MNKAGAVDFARLVDWLEGRLSDEESQMVAAEVAGADEATQADVAWLHTFYRASEQSKSVEAPTAVSEQLQRSFAAYAQSRRQPSFWQQLVAALTFDSFTGLAVGVRSAPTAQEQRQLIYETEKGLVICTVQARSQDVHLDLLGQFLPAENEASPAATILLRKENEEIDSTLTDDLGEFTLTALPAGVYDLVLTAHQYEITIPFLKIIL